MHGRSGKQLPLANVSAKNIASHAFLHKFDMLNLLLLYLNRWHRVLAEVHMLLYQPFPLKRW